MHLWLSKLKKFILINTPYVFLITGFIVPPAQTISVWIEGDITFTCLLVEKLNSFAHSDSLRCIFKTNYAPSKHCREEKGARCALGDSPDVKALPGWGCPHLAHQWCWCPPHLAFQLPTIQLPFWSWVTAAPGNQGCWIIESSEKFPFHFYLWMNVFQNIH